jgi:hypothetical protein
MILGAKMNMDIDPIKLLTDNAPEIAGSVVAFLHHFYVPAVVLLPEAGFWHMCESLCISVASGLIVHLIKPYFNKLSNGKKESND